MSIYFRNGINRKVDLTRLLSTPPVLYCILLLELCKLSPPSWAICIPASEHPLVLYHRPSIHTYHFSDYRAPPPTFLKIKKRYICFSFSKT